MSKSLPGANVVAMVVLGIVSTSCGGSPSAGGTDAAPDGTGGSSGAGGMAGADTAAETPPETGPDSADASGDGGNDAAAGAGDDSGIDEADGAMGGTGGGAGGMAGGGCSPGMPVAAPTAYATLGWGHTTLAAMAPGGATFAVAAPAGHLEVLTWADDSPKAISNGAFGASAIAYSIDGTLFVDSDDLGAHVWRVSDAALLRQLPELKAGVATGVARDGSVVAVGTWVGGQGQLLISRAAGVLTVNVGSGPTGFSGLAVSPDGSLIVAAYEEQTGSVIPSRGYRATAWRSADAGMVWTKSIGQGTDDPGAKVFFSPDGTRIAVGRFGAGDPTSLVGSPGFLANASDGSGSTSINGEVYGFSSDGQGLLVGRAALWLVRATDGMTVQTYPALPSNHEIVAATFTQGYDIELIARPTATLPDPPLVKISGAGAVVGMVPRISTTGTAYDVAISPDGAWVAQIIGAGEPLRLWDVAGRSVAASLGAGVHTEGPVAFSSDSTRLAFVQDSDVIIQPLPGKPGSAVMVSGATRALAFSPSGMLLATANGIDGATLWDATTGTLLRTTDPSLALRNGAIGSIALSPDGQTLATASGDIKLWKVSDGTFIRTIAGIGPLAFSADGQRLYGGEPGSSQAHLTHLTAWDPATGGIVKDFINQNLSSNVVYLPDGASFIGGDNGRGIATFGTSDGANLEVFARSEVPNALSLSRDGKVLASTYDSVVRVWCLP